MEYISLLSLMASHHHPFSLTHLLHRDSLPPDTWMQKNYTFFQHVAIEFNFQNNNAQVLSVKSVVGIPRSWGETLRHSISNTSRTEWQNTAVIIVCGIAYLAFFAIQIAYFKPPSLVGRYIKWNFFKECPRLTSFAAIGAIALGTFLFQLLSSYPSFFSAFNKNRRLYDRALVTIETRSRSTDGLVLENISNRATENGWEDPVLGIEVLKRRVSSPSTILLGGRWVFDIKTVLTILFQNNVPIAPQRFCNFLPPTTHAEKVTNLMEEKAHDKLVKDIAKFFSIRREDFSICIWPPEMVSRGHIFPPFEHDDYKIWHRILKKVRFFNLLPLPIVEKHLRNLVEEEEREYIRSLQKDSDFYQRLFNGIREEIKRIFEDPV